MKDAAQLGREGDSLATQSAIEDSVVGEKISPNKVPTHRSLFGAHTRAHRSCLGVQIFHVSRVRQERKMRAIAGLVF